MVWLKSCLVGENTTCDGLLVVLGLLADTLGAVEMGGGPRRVL